MLLETIRESKFEKQIEQLLPQLTTDSTRKRRLIPWSEEQKKVVMKYVDAK